MNLGWLIFIALALACALFLIDFDMENFTEKKKACENFGGSSSDYFGDNKCYIENGDGFVKSYKMKLIDDEWRLVK